MNDRYCYSQNLAPDQTDRQSEEKKNPVFESPIQILERKNPEFTYVRTGISLIDRNVRGLQKGGLSILSGLRGSAKSTLLTEILLNAIDDGNKALLYTGEVTAVNAMEWIYRQCAGPDFCNPTDVKNYYTTAYETKQSVAQWLDGKLFIYNNGYGHDFMKITEAIEAFAQEHRLDFIVFDNLMSLDLRHVIPEPWREQTEIQAQTQFIHACKRMAEKYDCHIAVVCHPRKAEGFLRLDDVSGSGNLTNAADACFIMHRVNEDFRMLLRKTIGFKKDAMIFQCDNVCEIAKDKQNGTQDCFIPLYFEASTKRLKNTRTENRVYPWNTAGIVPLKDNRSQGKTGTIAAASNYPGKTRDETMMLGFSGFNELAAGNNCRQEVARRF